MGPNLSVGEAADFLGVSVRTVYLLLADGRLRSAKLGRRRLIPRSEVERLNGELLDAGQAAPPAVRAS